MLYARVFDGTVAEDYYTAMDQIEGLMQPAREDLAPARSSDKVIALLESLQRDLVDPRQKELVAAIQESVFDIVNSKKVCTH